MLKDPQTAARWSRLWHGGLAAVALLSLAVQLWLVVAGGTDVSAGGAPPYDLGTRLVNFASYFTIQSNLLILVAAATLAHNPYRDGPAWRVLRLTSLLGIMITGLVFGAVLAGQVHLQGISVWVNAGLHDVTPWAALVGWLLFGPRPRITGQVVAWAFVWPAAWIGYTLVRGAVTGWYPYPFLDAAELGLPVALRNLGLVLVVALVLAALLRSLDRRLPASGVPAVPASQRARPAG